MSKRFMFLASLEKDLTKEDENKLFSVITNAIEEAGFVFTPTLSHALTTKMDLKSLVNEIEMFVPSEELGNKPLMVAKDGDDESDYVRCPACSNVLGSNDNLDYMGKPKFCDECGQALRY